jgi:hypothetical protein
MKSTFALSQESSVPESDRSILCFHINTSDRIQVLRIQNLSSLHLEKVVFPGQRLIFEALPEAQLEIYYSETVSRFVPCHLLQCY